MSLPGSLSIGERWMREALVESHAALPLCAPNPPVGCVIVRRDLQGRDPQGRDLQGRDLQGRDPQGRDLQGRDPQGRDLDVGGQAGGQIVARGFTGRPGQPHAEAAALARLPAELDPRELDLYVTLEPCSFAGRTPSCALAIVASGIRRVHVATLDPHPRNCGRGIQVLRNAGIQVQLGVLEDAVLAFIKPYLWSETVQPPAP